MTPTLIQPTDVTSLVIDKVKYIAVEDTDTEFACDSCSLFHIDCTGIHCSRFDRKDGRDVHFKRTT